MVNAKEKEHVISMTTTSSPGWSGCLHVEGRYGWLSITSYHSFIIDSVVWPSVLHYISAKRFEGTLFEEEIRRCKSIDMLISATKPRYIVEIDEDKVPHKIEVYGKGKSYRVRDDWRGVYLSYLEEATRAKFSNPALRAKLLQTKGMRIIDKQTPQNGVCLEKIRAELDTPKQIEIPIVPEQLYKNLERSERIEREVGVILDMFRYIRRMEGCKVYYSEMMEDVIENIVGPEKTKEIVKYSKTIVWNDVSPYVELLIKSLRDRIVKLGEKGVRIDADHAFRASLLLATFFGLTKDVAFPSKEDIKLPPKSRWYRSSVAIPKRRATSTPIDKSIESHPISINTFHDW